MLITSAPSDLEDLFGERWDRRRSIHDDARLLVAAVARALESAGWWRPGCGEAVAGGLVVAREWCPAGPAAAFEQSGAPSEFLFALPSSAAAVVGLAVGLLEYQATLCGPPLGALRHALEQLAAGRLERVVAASLELHQGRPAARAVCLDRATAADPLLSRWSRLP